MCNAVWSKRGEEAGGHRKKATVLQVWGGRAQEVGVPANKKREKRKRSSTTAKCVEEGEGT